MSTIYGENGLANKIDLRYLYNIIYILSPHNLQTTPTLKQTQNTKQKTKTKNKKKHSTMVNTMRTKQMIRSGEAPKQSPIKRKNIRKDYREWKGKNTLSKFERKDKIIKNRREKSIGLNPDFMCETTKETTSEKKPRSVNTSSDEAPRKLDKFSNETKKWLCFHWADFPMEVQRMKYSEVAAAVMGARRVEWVPSDMTSPLLEMIT